MSQNTQNQGFPTHMEIFEHLAHTRYLHQEKAKHMLDIACHLVSLINSAAGVSVLNEVIKAQNQVLPISILAQKETHIKNFDSSLKKLFKNPLIVAISDEQEPQNEDKDYILPILDKALTLLDVKTLPVFTTPLFVSIGAIFTDQEDHIPHTKIDLSIAATAASEYVKAVMMGHAQKVTETLGVLLMVLDDLKDENFSFEFSNVQYANLQASFDLIGMAFEKFDFKNNECRFTISKPTVKNEVYEDEDTGAITVAIDEDLATVECHRLTFNLKESTEALLSDIKCKHTEDLVKLAAMFTVMNEIYPAIMDDDEGDNDKIDDTHIIQ